MAAALGRLRAWRLERLVRQMADSQADMSPADRAEYEALAARHRQADGELRRARRERERLRRR